MPIRTHTCITVACDVCGYVYDQDEYVCHFDDLTEARTVVEQIGWLITSDGRVHCASEDEAHQAATDALMPPAPVTVPDGQTAIDLAADAGTDDGLREQLAEAVKGARIRLMPDPIVMTMIHAGSGFHLKDEEAAPVADAVLPVITRHTQQLVDQRTQLQHQIEQQHAALERVHQLAADLERAGWSQAAIARRIHAALDQPETDPAAHRSGDTDVQGHCPACGWASLFLGDGGYITCARIDCPEPDAATTLLEKRPGAHRPGDTNPATLVELRAITEEMNRSEPRRP